MSYVIINKTISAMLSFACRKNFVGYSLDYNDWHYIQVRGYVVDESD